MNPLLKFLYLLLLKLTLIVVVFACGTFVLGDDVSPFWYFLFFSLFFYLVVYVPAVSFIYHHMIDTTWLVLNTAGILYYTIENTKDLRQLGTWILSVQSAILHALLCWILAVFLPILVVIRCIWLFKLGNITDYLHPKGKYSWTSRLGAYYGFSFFKFRFIGETRLLNLARGVVAVVLLAGTVAFSFIVTIADPGRESVLTPTQTSRGASLTQDLLTSFDFTWGVVLARLPPDFNDASFSWEKSQSQFLSAIDVTPWTNSTHRSGKHPLNCTYIPDTGYQKDIELPIINFFCSSSHGMDSNILSLEDLLITVNFTRLGQPSNSSQNILSSSVQVLVAMTNNTARVVDFTSPTILVPGVNLVGVVDIEISQVTKNVGLSLIGLYDNLDTFGTATIKHIFPDPLASVSSRIPRTPDIGTIRIVSPLDMSQWTVNKDHRDNTILSGLSQTGGLWTFLSGVFAALFGSSLMRILFGQKSLPIFGLAHTFQRKTIRNAYLEKYPGISTDFADTTGPKGTLHLIRDHLLDLTLIEESDNEEATSADDESIPLSVRPQRHNSTSTVPQNDVGEAPGPATDASVRPAIVIDMDNAEHTTPTNAISGSIDITDATTEHHETPIDTVMSPSTTAVSGVDSPTTSTSNTPTATGVETSATARLIEEIDRQRLSASPIQEDIVPEVINSQRQTRTGLLAQTSSRRGYSLLPET